MKFKYILALDQGTTSSRAILFDKTVNIKALAQKEFQQFDIYNISIPNITTIIILCIKLLFNNLNSIN